MRIESKLCHISEKKAVVQVIGWINDRILGSALAEGPTVEVAEDKAISRLNKRINAVTKDEPSINTNNEHKSNTPLRIELPNSEKVELPKREKAEDININQEPNDWSSELTAIDAEIERLKWSRDDEINFLEKTLGYNNRNKITSYTDIVKYLSLLKKTDNKNPFKVSNGNLNTLIEESDIILRDLSWDHKQGREFLQKEFNVLSRNELNESQLVSFVEKLKLIRNQYLGH
ncbi:hypothetical protein [Prochlorococcus sp. MIT 0801]|uniref:hypothetical protein n=1 Tax=Prochlorococcus sp. MIT 0801 TaxID=1501269 RepID=UPI0004F779ED|nr:hypothetical protein [Prochlorococcus sp. MIT 0801]AIQ97158.1 hypothetical protein EW15_1066 [Prochlorococcus sp. MIT 0801]